MRRARFGNEPVESVPPFRFVGRPELIVDGATGFLVDDVEGAVDAVDRTRALDRTAIRAHAVAPFGRARMVDAYIDAYEAVTRDRR